MYINSKERLIDMIVSFIEVYKERQIIYDDLNDKMKEIQGDFYTNIEMIDSCLSNKLFDVIDYIIEDISGSKDIMCHIVYDTALVYVADVKYDLKNKEELKKFLMLE